MPEDMLDRVPEHIAEDMPGRMPEDMPDRMPEDMPDKMPEDMSDRMPEDLPVTKRINVMVGIIRSKVIVPEVPILQNSVPVSCPLSQLNICCNLFLQLLELCIPNKALSCL